MQLALSRSTDGGNTFQRVASFPIRVMGILSMDHSPSFPQMAIDMFRSSLFALRPSGLGLIVLELQQPQGFVPGPYARRQQA